MNTPTVAHRITGPARPPASIVLVPLAVNLSPRGDVAVIVARLKREMERLDDADRAYIVALVQRHIVAGVAACTA